MSYYYNRAGTATDYEGWKAEYRKGNRVARTKISDAADPSRECDVSTVWLGIDYSFGSLTPIIFETMVFDAGNTSDEYCRRYSSESEALTGHRAIVAMASAEMADPIIIDVE